MLPWVYKIRHKKSKYIRIVVPGETDMQTVESRIIQACKPMVFLSKSDLTTVTADMEKLVQEAISRNDPETLQSYRDTLNSSLFASKFVSSHSPGEMVKSKSIPGHIEAEAFIPASSKNRGFWAVKYVDL